MTSRDEQTLGYAILGVFSLIALLPIVGHRASRRCRTRTAARRSAPSTACTSATSRTPGSEGNFGSYLKSSVIVAVVVVASPACFSILSGYAFGLMRFRGSTVLFYVFLLGPDGADGGDDRAALLRLPRPRADRHLLGADPAADRRRRSRSGRSGCGRSSAACRARWSRRRGSTAPRSWFTLWRVLLPLARPAVLTMTVLLFMWTWNEFLLALVMVSDEGLRTAPLGLSFFQGRNTSDLTLLAAGSVIVALPVVILYVFLQRHFIRGMLAGAVKG